MEKITNILVADDHPVMRSGIKSVIESEPGFIVSAEAKNGAEAYKLLKENTFDIVTLDVEMPEISGLEIARKITEEKIQVKIIFLTMYKDEDMFNQALDTGAMGYILKENVVQDIMDCVKLVSEGNYYISPTISQYLINREKKIKDVVDSSPSVNNLTKTERLILKLVAEEKTTREIAKLLHISYKTVENHRSNISRKLDLHGTHSLVKFAISNKAIL